MDALGAPCVTDVYIRMVHYYFIIIIIILILYYYYIVVHTAPPSPNRGRDSTDFSPA